MCESPGLFYCVNNLSIMYRPAPSNYLSHSLIELLNQISPGFKRNFAVLQKRRTGRHPFERVATPYQVMTKTHAVAIKKIK